MEDHEVVVVGAGYAGLVAAERLRAAGRDVIVLEARSRVGGRVHTDRSGGAPLDLGGMWVGARHHRVRALLAETRHRTFPTPTGGRSVWYDHRRGRRTTARFGVGPSAALPGLALARIQLDAAARRTAPPPPGAPPHAERLDATTVAEWMRRRVPGGQARAALELALVGAGCVELSEVSMLTLLSAVADAGGIARLLGTAGGAQQDLVVGGADGPARALAERLGRRIHLEEPILAIRHDGDGATVSSTRTDRCARHVVLAIPPRALLRLRVSPALPPGRDHLLSRMPMGSVHKAMVTFEAASWRTHGWSGAVLDAEGPIGLCQDVTPPSGTPTLALLTCGRRGRAMAARPRAERRALVHAALARWFGPAALRPRRLVEHSWDADPWSRGGYQGLPTPGTTTQLLRTAAAPVGRLHVAGTETATRGRGFIEGAVRSGERVAREVLAALDVDGQRAGAPGVSQVGRSPRCGRAGS